VDRAGAILAGLDRDAAGGPDGGTYLPSEATQNTIQILHELTVSIASVFASTIGPPLPAETLRQTGSYNLIFRVRAATVVVLSLGCWLFSEPSV